jgi:hypothetical protein
MEQKERTKEQFFLRGVSCCHFNSSVCQTSNNVSFFADTGHWLLSKGIVAINNVCVIQKSLLNEQNHEEQKEL